VSAGPTDARLVERVRARLGAADTAPTRGSVALALRHELGPVGDAALLGAVDAVRRELVGAGPLEPLLAEPGVSDVVVNGPNDVWFDRGRGLERASVRLRDEAAVRGLAVRLAAVAGRRLDDASPWVDARLPGAVRLHAVVPPVSPHGTLLSLRIPPVRAFTLAQLEAAGSLDRPAVQLLERVVAARLAFLVTGGTGTGKTTMLSTLLGLVPPAERLVLVEDSGELRPDHPHVVRLEARPPNVEGAGAVSLRDLVRQALRMRPDRLVVGEVRGAEVADLLTALNTGHEGGCGTVHANSPVDLPARIEALGSLAGLDRGAVHSQLAAAVDVVVHLARRSAGGDRTLRRLESVCVLVHDGAVVRVVPAYGPGASAVGAARLAALLDSRAPR
jgi:pilus assembly protein CpaF